MSSKSVQDILKTKNIEDIQRESNDLLAIQKTSLQTSVKYVRDMVEIGSSINEELDIQGDKLKHIDTVNAKISANLRRTDVVVDEMRSCCFSFRNGKKKNNKKIQKYEVPEPIPAESVRNIKNEVQTEFSVKDPELTEIQTTVHTLKHIALKIGDELVVQNPLIEKIQSDIIVNREHAQRLKIKIDKID